MKTVAISRKLGMSLSIAALFLVVAPAAAMASSAGVSADELGIGAHITSLLNVITGPIAKLIAAIMVVLGIILMSRGHDMGEGVKTIGTIALGVGVLIGLGNILGKIGSSASDSSGSLIPMLATHAAIVSQHATLLVK